MSIEVSVILPSYNRYPLNMLSLYALKNQTFDFSKMEVLLIDDASTDETHLLQNYSAPYPFRYIRNKTNLGRSKSRNIGIKKARGDILIFLDAEVIVDPDFVKNHYQRHLSNEQLVVTGKNTNKVFSFLFPEFTQSQLGTFEEIVHHSPLVKNRLETNVKKNSNKPVQLLFEEDCRSFSTIKHFSVPKKYEQNIMRAFSDDFRLPWISCTTLNHSVKKKLVDSVGGFDEQFIGHGLEDYEYGYRLYKAGTNFSYDPNIYIYHQEHPKEKDWKEHETKNLIYFQQKHPYIDVCLLSLERIHVYDYKFMDNIMAEYQALSQNYPAMFNDFKKAILVLLQQIPLLKAEGKPVTSLLKSTGIEDDEEWRNRLLIEHKALGKYGLENLTKLFDLLIRH
ncbi:GT2 family glycosyltransferase [Neobacillus niacini]|uniref:glycosyltransferase family 2 protein n=1 Tax=Neobacillus niacini TaxID=86668 RepID=UPI002863CDF0|nr:glycosyltransferase [Neobacillus niacini]MDR7076117.1 GT2 family glycosyltransferase [Neobacillus niacini]